MAMQRKVPLGAPEELLILQEVEDALAASSTERMEAALTLLDTAYSVWLAQGVADEQGLCRFPGCTQQRKSPLRPSSG
jgi:hypothetical protein